MNDKQVSIIRAILAKNTEHSIQAAFFATLALYREQYPIVNSKLVFAVPNGEQRNKVTAARVKAQGAKRGVSDVIVLIPNGNYHYLCIEFKEPKGRGVVSNDQHEFSTYVKWVGGKYVVVSSYIDAIAQLNKYLNIEIKPVA